MHNRQCDSDMIKSIIHFLGGIKQEINDLKYHKNFFKLSNNPKTPQMFLKNN